VHLFGQLNINVCMLRMALVQSKKGFLILYHVILQNKNVNVLKPDSLE